jgi:hypothetical protein
MDVRDLRVHRSQCCPVPRQPIQPLRVAHRGPHRRSIGHQQLHHLQQSVVFARRFHAARMRHRTKVFLRIHYWLACIPCILLAQNRQKCELFNGFVLQYIYFIMPFNLISRHNRSIWYIFPLTEKNWNRFRKVA